MQIQRYNYILLLVIASSLLNPSLASKQSSFCSGEEDFLETNPMATLGGVKDSPASNSAEIDSLARFAVDEHNKKEVCLVFGFCQLRVDLNFLYHVFVFYVH